MSISVKANDDPKPTYDTIEDALFPPEEVDEDEEKREAFWILTRKQLNKLTNEEKACFGITPDEPGPLLARLYCDYLRMVQQLDVCWGQTFQYQKSQAMRKVLDGAMVRLMEIKNELTDKVDISELHYVDGQIIELKLIPHDLEIIKLSSIPVTRNEQLEELMNRLYNGERIYIPPKEEEEEVEEEEMVEIKPFRPHVSVDPLKEQMAIAIAIIQKHERARLGRLEHFDEVVMIQLKKDAIAMKRGKKVSPEEKYSAATKIQSLWRAYVVRREMKKRHYRVRMEIKMDVPSWRDDKLDNIHNICLAKKREKREQKAREYIDTCIREKERVLKLVGPGLMEDIGDEIRYWFKNWYDVAHAFDKYPTEEEGGTIMVVRGETMTPEEYRIEMERKRREKEKMKGNAALAKKIAEEKAKAKKLAAEAKKKEKERIKKEKKALAKRAKAGIIEPFTYSETKGLKQIAEANEDMDEDWTLIDQTNMRNNDPIMEKITDQKCYEVQLEIRTIVDDLMRLELEILLAAHAKDRKQKKKPPKKKKKKSKKKKGKKDITGHRTIEDLFQELYDNRVIRTYPQYSLKDFYGDYSYNNFDLRAVDYDPLPAIGDIRQVVINNIIMPLGGQTLPKPKSALICGPKSSGKHVLLYAICNECEAVMFDISPEILYGKYNGTKQMKLLCHMVNKVARILQPSVIYIDGGEKPFYKKVPKPEKQFQPKKMKKYIFKDLVKPITDEDRVMLLATSNQPWNTAAGPFVKCFEKVIMIPRTDYGTVYQLWMDILMKYHAIHRDINVSALAKLSIGYPIPYIKKVAEFVLCPARVIRLKFEPLRCHELLEGLMTQGMPEPITIKEQDKYTKFFTTKVKLAKQRKKIVGIKRKARVELERAAEKEREAANKKK